MINSQSKSKSAIHTQIERKHSLEFLSFYAGWRQKQRSLLKENSANFHEPLICCDTLREIWIISIPIIYRHCKNCPFIWPLISLPLPGIPSGRSYSDRAIYTINVIPFYGIIKKCIVFQFRFFPQFCSILCSFFDQYTFYWKKKIFFKDPDQ